MRKLALAAGVLAVLALSGCVYDPYAYPAYAVPAYPGYGPYYYPAPVYGSVGFGFDGGWHDHDHWHHWR